MTFRLRAPEAKKVTVAGDFGNDVDLRAGEDGILETDGAQPPALRARIVRRAPVSGA